MDFNTLIEIFYTLYKERTAVYPTNGSQSDITKWNEATLDFFRIQLEPYVFKYLEHTYGAVLDAHWMTHTFPKKSRYALVIVERRCHPNWWFILRNIAWAAPYCSLYIFCSDTNQAVLQSYLGDKADTVHLIPWFTGDVSRDEGRIQTNITFKTAEFYKMIDAEYMLRFEMDTYFLQKVPETIFVGDFYGSPWGWVPDRPGGGGLTVRKLSAMIDICEKDRELIDPSGEDAWIGNAILKHGYSVPPIEFRSQVFLENSPPRSIPIGIHQFWTFVMNFNIQDRPVFENIVKNLVTVRI